MPDLRHALQAAQFRARMLFGFVLSDRTSRTRAALAPFMRPLRDAVPAKECHSKFLLQVLRGYDYGLLQARETRLPTTRDMRNWQQCDFHQPHFLGGVAVMHRTPHEDK